MVQLNLPKELLPKESFKTLAAKEKDEYISNLLKKILELNPDGITISQIREATGFNYSTIWHHVEMLKSTAQCHKTSHGNLDIYHHRGSTSHLNEYKKGKSTYELSIVEHKDGKFISIHEKRENRTGNQAVHSGVLIPLELLDDFIEEFKKAKEHHLNAKKVTE